MFSKAGKYELQTPDQYSQSNYYIFTPTLLCSKSLINIDDEMALLLAKAHRLLGILEGMSGFIPTIDVIESMLIKKEALLSCQIDGIDVPFDNIFDLSKVQNKKVSSVLNYIKATYYVEESLEAKHISNRFLCEIHKVLMKNASNEDVGQFRKIQTFIGPHIYVENFPNYNPPATENMKIALSDLEKFINSDDNIDVLIKLALIHYQFETIHPFSSGNGRTGRILICMFLKEKKILSRKLLCLSDFLLPNKIEYFDRLMEVRRKGNYEQWVKFFIKAVIVAAEDSINVINKLLELREKNLSKIMTLGKTSKTSMLLYEYIERKPIIDIKETADVLKLSFNTISKAVEGFQKIEILKQSNNLIRNRCFAYSKYLQIIEHKIQ